MQLLEKKRVIITGGTSGIGKAIAILFAAQGADVAIFGTQEEKAKKAVEEISLSLTRPEQQVLLKLADVADFERMNHAIQEILETWGSVDILVNNAGITRDSLLLKMTEEMWDEVIDVNLKSVFNTCKPLIRSMIKERKGKIINISSVLALTGNAGQVNYTASKAGIIGFTKSLAREVAKKNITVNCIAPGYIETPMTHVLPDPIKEQIIEEIPMGRVGLPKEIADAALFLASHLSDYITGQVLIVDGGFSL